MTYGLMGVFGTAGFFVVAREYRGMVSCGFYSRLGGRERAGMVLWLAVARVRVRACVLFLQGGGGE